MKLSIVIPNWNGSEKIRRHMPIVLQLAQEEGALEVIVVDDGSKDDSVEVIKENFSEVILIKKESNSGFSSTVNLGVSHAKGEIVFLLNNDARPSKGFWENVQKHFTSAKVFSVGCNVGGLWSIGRFSNGYFWHGQAKESLKTNAFHQTLWVSGGSGFFRKSIWNELGGLDNLFDPFYEEDVDLGYRATKRGFINIWEPKSLVDHYQEKGVIESNFKKSLVSAIAQRNQLIFIWKNITNQKFILEHKKALLKMIVSHPGYLKIIFSAFKRFGEIQRKSEIEIRSNKLTDEQVLAIFEQDWVS